MPSNPGKPRLPVGSVIGLPKRSFTTGPLVRKGLIDCAPNRPLNPVYPPGSPGSRSFWPEAHTGEPCAQCTASPTKSACGLALAAALAGVFGSSLAASASACWGEGLPNTLVMSPVGRVLTFSKTMFAPATAPKSHPARVYGTQGAGMFEPSGPTILNDVGVPAEETGSVQ